MKIVECVNGENGDCLEDVSLSVQSVVESKSKMSLPSGTISSVEPHSSDMGDDLCTSLKALSMQDALVTEKNSGTTNSEYISTVSDDQPEKLTLDMKMMSLEEGCKASVSATETSKTEVSVDQEKPSSVDHEHIGRGLPQEHEDTSAEGSQNSAVYIARGPHGGIPVTPTTTAPYPWPEALCRQRQSTYEYDLNQHAKFVRPNVVHEYGNGRFMVDSSVPLTTDQCNGFNFGPMFNCQVSQTAHTGMLSGGCVTVQPMHQQPTTTQSAAPFVSSLPQADLCNQQRDFVDDIIQECILDSSADLDYFPSGNLLSGELDVISSDPPIPTHVSTVSSNQSDGGYFSPPYTNSLSPYSPAGTDSSAEVFTDDHSNDSQTLLSDEQLLLDLTEIIAQETQTLESPPICQLPGPLPPNFRSLNFQTPPVTSQSAVVTYELQHPDICTLQSQMPTPISHHGFVSMASVPGVCNTVTGPYIITGPAASVDPTGIPSGQNHIKYDGPSKFREIRPKPHPESDLLAPGNITCNIIAGVNNSGFHVPQPLPCEDALIKTDEDRQRHVRFCRELAEYQKSQLRFQDPEGDTLLHLAIARKELTFIAALLPRMKRDGLISELINKVNENKWTPLHIAVMTNQVATAAELIKYGAHANIQIHYRREGNNYVFFKPIHHVAGKGYRWTNMLEVLLTAPDIDVHAFDSEGRTALHRAVQEHDGIQVDSRRSIYLLVQAGADLAKQDQRTGETALHYAIKKKNVEFVAWILGLVCEMVRKTTSPEQLEHRQRAALKHIINMPSSSSPGVTPIQIAFRLAKETPNERIKMMELLLRNGAELSSRTDSSIRKELSNIPELKELVKNSSNSSRN